jgi:hypothetical protein
LDFYEPACQLGRSKVAAVLKCTLMAIVNKLFIDSFLPHPPEGASAINTREKIFSAGKVAFRVTRCFVKKIAQNLAQPVF